MSLRLLIDECLSPDLVDLAVAAGHVESTCLRDRGLLGTQDWTLMKHVLAS
jgi:predicted nuclease of predicted toxin-antitoxin system